MPARKPTALNSRNKTKDKLAAQREAEQAAHPSTLISCDPPDSLQDLPIASAIWTRVISLQNETQTAQNGSPIITAFDERLLEDYCRMIEEAQELSALRKDLQIALQALTKEAQKLKIKDNSYEYFLEIWTQVNKLTANFRGMDARVDTKRAHIKKAAESLYLTPRSRAGVAPAEKQPEKPKSEMDKLLG
jgi:hypothetical protein